MLPPTTKTTLLTENGYSILFSNVSVVLAIAIRLRNLRYTGTPVGICLGFVVGLAAQQGPKMNARQQHR
jgi:hypothetical protein